MSHEYAENRRHRPEEAGGGGSGGRPPPSSYAPPPQQHARFSDPRDNRGRERDRERDRERGRHSSHDEHGASFSPGSQSQYRNKQMPPENNNNYPPPVTPPHMPSQHMRSVPSSASSAYSMPSPYGHSSHGRRTMMLPAHGKRSNFVPYSRHPDDRHSAHEPGAPNVSHSGSESDHDSSRNYRFRERGGTDADSSPPRMHPPPASSRDSRDRMHPPSRVNGAPQQPLPPPPPASFTSEDFEPPRETATRRQGRQEGILKRAHASGPQSSRQGPEEHQGGSSNPKRQRLQPNTSDASGRGGNLSPTLTFGSRCDSYDVTRPIAGLDIGVGSYDTQILHSWSSNSLSGRPNSPSDIRVCYEGWQQRPNRSSGGFPSTPSRSSWEEPLPINCSSSAAPQDERRWGPPTSQGSAPPPARQGSFGRDRYYGGYHRPTGSGEFRPVDGRYHKNKPPPPPPHPGHPHGHGWYEGAPPPSYSPRRHVPQGRDDIEAHLASPSSRGRAPSGSWGRGDGQYARPYHYGPPPPRPRHDDSRREPSPPSTLPHPQVYNASAPFMPQADQLRTSEGILLLAQPDDRISLSETLCVVRENIEVFAATEADVKAPAPGRKRPVVVGQIGLRCIHCRNATQPGDRVKRAICFPSSIKRIYRTVIDMKLDHFKACRYVPVELKAKLAELKATNGRSTGTTMQYFVQAARKMGMVDSPNGVRYEQSNGNQNPNDLPPAPEIHRSRADTKESLALAASQSSFDRQIGLSNSSSSGEKKIKSDGSGVPIEGSSSTLSMDSVGVDDSKVAAIIKTKGSEGNEDGSPRTFFTGKVPLALPEDKTALSPLRCFLRENVYAFSATAEDIAVRTPTTFSVVLGQVGIGCVHCYSLPAKERSNRAVCFPFSVNRIYQSVADIQRFHLNECKMVPESAREKFVSLQSASSKGSKGLATRQYWVTSAKKLGLVDTPQGIRFARDPASPAAQPVSLDILAQVASDVTTASKPLVLPEDKPHIAEFLYVVMEQLQPCRFTEADRNKRRLKDLGCTGVECKHCAGQVESRKFFWSSVNAVESNFVSVHTHMMECKSVPKEIKEHLAELKLLRKEQTAKLKVGSQKAFFGRVWNRLHSDDGKPPQVAEKKELKDEQTTKHDAQHERAEHEISEHEMAELEIAEPEMAEQETAKHDIAEHDSTEHETTEHELVENETTDTEHEVTPV